MITFLWARKLVLLTCAIFITFGLAAEAGARPKLILLIVIDQFRSDYLSRFENRFLPSRDSKGDLGGFRYLMEQGAYYPFAKYDLLQAMTGPGHATILTGAYPYQMGIPTNNWYDHQRKSRTYCAEDPIHATVGAATSVKNAGTSPANLIGTTVGDELKNAGYASRVVSLALKDRASILMGGHRADIALWFEPKSFRWVSSTYYLPDGKLPAWVDNENNEIAKSNGKSLVWETTGQGTGLSLLDSMVTRERWPPGIGLTFPHEAKIGTHGSLSMPYALEITERLAQRALAEYKLGNGNATDVLAVSFSSHDYLGHAFGPNSREMEEMTIADDRVIAKLLNAVKKSVPGGLANVVIAFTADHGAPSNPDWLKSVGIPAGRFDESAIRKTIEDRLKEKFGKTGNNDPWLIYYNDLNYFLNRDAITEKKLDSALLENEVREVLRAVPGAAHVFTRTDYVKRTLPPGMHERHILKTYFEGRSGDVILIPRPFFMSSNDTVGHMTGYTYDSTVPIILAGPGIKAGVRAEPAEVIDIATTLSWLTKTTAPAVSEGRVLIESLSEQATKRKK